MIVACAAAGDPTRGDQRSGRTRAPGHAGSRSQTEHVHHRHTPFESVLRAIAIDVVGLSVVPQVGIGGVTFLGRPDLVDLALRIVLEADSFEWHSSKDALEKDVRRYNNFVVNGWLVLRFAWKDVMHDAAWVTEILEAAVHERTQVCRCLCCAA